MPVAMTFNSLTSDLQRYLERGGSVIVDPIVFEQLPSLINLAERRIARELKVQGFLKAVTGAMSAGVGIYEKPARWRETVSINVTSPLAGTARVPVFPRSYEYLRAFAPDPAEVGVPAFYSDYDYTHWIFGPTPSAAFTYEVLFYELPALLDDTNQTNWLTDYAPNLLLYGALLEASPFIKADERIAVWQSMYDRAAAALDSEDTKKVLDRSSRRTEA